MNKLFINITKSLISRKIKGSPPVTLEGILKTIMFHQSIDKIRKTYECNKNFSFQQVTEEQVWQVILSIDGSKATPVGYIPADMLRVTLDNLNLDILDLSLIKKPLIYRLKMDVFQTI